jgi:hypothetical protein
VVVTTLTRPKSLKRRLRPRANRVFPHASAVLDGV